MPRAFDYQQSIGIAKSDPSFFAILFALFRKADDVHLDILKQGFPEYWLEFKRRYNSPGGFLVPEEREEMDAFISQIREPEESAGYDGSIDYGLHLDPRRINNSGR